MLNQLLLMVKGATSPYTYTPTSEPLDNIGLGGDYLNKGLSYLKPLVQSWYSLCMLIGASGFVLCLIAIGIKLMLTKSSRKRGELVQQIGYEILVLLALCLVVTVFGTIFTIINNVI